MDHLNIGITTKLLLNITLTLSEFLWIKWLNTAMPANMFVREILGIILICCLYDCSSATLLLLQKYGKMMIEKVGYMRYYIFIVLLLLMMSLPIKMVLRWLFALEVHCCSTRA